MGVWMNLLVAPSVPFTMTREQFLALVRDLVDKKIVEMPGAMLGGAVSVASPLGMANIAACLERERRDGVDVYYKGDDSVSLLRTCSEVPYGQSDLCVWFTGFNEQNATLWQSFEQWGFANADVVLYALAEPQMMQCYDLYQGTEGAEHYVQWCLRTTGKRGPWAIAGTPLESLLIEHFGQDLIVECSYA